jgi:glc operon protein GlcG
MIDEAFLSRNNVKLSTKGSHVILHAAEKEAARIGVPQCIAVVDEGGHLLAFSRMDGARIGSIGIAITKAVSAATRKRPTSEEGGGDALTTVRLALAAGEGQLTGLGGGVPIMFDAQVIGAVGVSSGTMDQDLQVGQAGIAAFMGAPADGAAKR